MNAAQSQVKGLRPLREWLNMAEDRSGTLRRRLTQIYGGQSSAVEESARVLASTLSSFGESFGWDKSVLVVRACGRINLMGMHVDHRGGAVHPIAVKEVYFVVEPREDDTVLLRDVNGAEFQPEQFRIGDCLPGRKIGNWDAWCHDEFEKRRNDRSVTWSNYIRAPVLYLQHLRTRPDGVFDPPLRGMNAVVCGNVPRAAGLSTSSSLVVAAAEACMRINGIVVSPMEFIDICCYGEWYVGTRGGAGDHAAIKFGKPNAVVRVGSLPFSVEVLPFPPGYKVVWASSLVEAKKQAGARDAFNNRVAAYAFGLMLARKLWPQYAKKLEHLRDINPETLGTDEAGIYRILKSLPARATRADVLRMLADEEAEVRHVFRSHVEPADGYKIRQVCAYGVCECIRSSIASECLRKGDIRTFGEMLNVSHDADRVTRIEGGKRVPVDNAISDAKIEGLIADLESGDAARAERARLWRQPGGYDVSVPELDELVDIARGVPGVVGARLVGAGLGGSMIAVAEESQAARLIERFAAEYYEPRKLPLSADVVAPVEGAGILDV